MFSTKFCLTQFQRSYRTIHSSCNYRWYAWYLCLHYQITEKQTLCNSVCINLWDNNNTCVIVISNIRLWILCLTNLVQDLIFWIFSLNFISVYISLSLIYWFILLGFVRFDFTKHQYVFRKNICFISVFIIHSSHRTNKVLYNVAVLIFYMI